MHCDVLISNRFCLTFRFFNQRNVKKKKCRCSATQMRSRNEGADKINIMIIYVLKNVLSTKHRRRY